jgi:uncharacterized protein with PIN domain
VKKPEVQDPKCPICKDRPSDSDENAITTSIRYRGASVSFQKLFLCEKCARALWLNFMHREFTFVRMLRRVVWQKGVRR